MCFVNGNVDYDDDEEEDDFDYDYEEDYEDEGDKCAPQLGGNPILWAGQGVALDCHTPACQSCWGKDNDFKN